MTNTQTIKRFNVTVTNSVMNQLSQKEGSLITDITTDQITCANADYSDVIVIPKPITFISVKEHLPTMELDGDWYYSPTCLLLTQGSDEQFSVEHGFLAKFTDDDHLLWYEDDSIENVVGWMPYPKEQPTESKTALIRKLLLQHDHKKEVYWSLNFKEERSIPAPDCFMSVVHGLPPLYIEKEGYIVSDVYLVEYEYGTANGVFTGISTAKLIFDKDAETLKWDRSGFFHRHTFPRDVINWKKLPMDIFFQFQE